MLDPEIQRAIEAFPLDAWALDNGFEQESKHEWTATCPRCLKPKKLVVNIDRRRWHCWVCQKQEMRSVRDYRNPMIQFSKKITVEGGGGVVKLMAWWYGCSSHDALVWILNICRPGPLDLFSLGRLEMEDLEENPEFEMRPPPPPEGMRQLSGASYSYLGERGISAHLADAYGLFECGPGRYEGRIVFPAWGKGGGLLYWQARATWPAGRDEGIGRRHIKVLNPPRSEKGDVFTSEHTVFNLHRAVVFGAGHVALCEGPISAIHAGDDAVALWGKQLYGGQLRALIDAGVSGVDVMFDGPTPSEPEGAWAEACELARRLVDFFNPVRLVRLPAGDPGDYDRPTNVSFRGASHTVARVPLLERL